jgi:hypothetical protein
MQSYSQPWFKMRPLAVRSSRSAPHDRLIVRTRNSTYEIVVMVPYVASVMVRGGAFFPDFTPARVAGSSLGGGFLKLHGV